MRRTHRAGIFEAFLETPPAGAPADYTIRVETGSRRHDIHDPYAFPSMLTDFDLHLLGEGRHWKSYEKLGAQIHVVDGVAGVNFAVWAPNAESVGVVGDFNGWDGRVHQMHKRIPSGVWELFVPGVKAGDNYKYRIHAHGTLRRPGRSLWLRRRGAAADGLAGDRPAGLRLARRRLDGRPRRPQLACRRRVNVYEVHLGSWRRPGDDPKALAHLRRSRARARALLRRDGIHARRVPAPHGASASRRAGATRRSACSRPRAASARPRT